jgi:hypothetical protein
MTSCNEWFYFRDFALSSSNQLSTAISSSGTRAVIALIIRKPP